MVAPNARDFRATNTVTAGTPSSPPWYTLGGLLSPSLLTSVHTAWGDISYSIFSVGRLMWCLTTAAVVVFIPLRRAIELSQSPSMQGL
mmetsp:Transcript_29890/g.75212  ORF Transcript_29890/g.75212 Transcript_29890/m.75212 type:complete len:88 (+) Transcript_29890:93-356(+)|eukprot:CAMPEP_0177655092 /NCGR_PEP_ID=MMETSP0447-20121125/14746_1 /TAXON_ID=0 /ORGANISM="Stygamoeba regulata, Strain BSH-02190019" /LENGTH=87 /DNA_ID=CAMNT_0019158915 /DNA_START=67 /DNA_END=333 /DNA_ORIENTATION=+